MLRRPATLPALVLLLVAIAYGPALANGFVWDDAALIAGDPTIRSWRSILDGWNQRLFFDQQGSEFFRPLQRLTFTLDYALFELRPWGYHLMSILWHLGAMAAFAWGSRPLVARWLDDGSLPLPEGYVAAERAAWESRLCWMAALIWGLHPVLTAAVTYVSGRADPMAACFTWLAVGLMGRTVTDSGAGPQVRSGTLALAAAACLGAALSKEVGLMSFVLCTLALPWRKVGWRLLLGWLVLAALAVAAYFFNRSALEGDGPGLGAVTPWAARPWLMLEALAEYARLMIAPVDLTMDRSAPGELPSLRAGLPWWVLSGAGVLVLAGWVAAFWRSGRQPVERICLVAAACIYLPTSNLLSLNAAVAEHWLYQPLQWIVLWACLRVARLQPAWTPELRRLLAVVLVAWLALLGLRTAWRQGDWRSNETFFAATLAEAGDSPRMVANLGVSLATADPVKARELYLEALRRNPGLQRVRISLAALELRYGNFAGVHALVDTLQPARDVEANYWILRSELARAEGSGNGWREIRQASLLRPLNWRVRRREAELLVEQGKPKEAMLSLADYCADVPFRAEAWDLLAQVAKKAGSPGWKQAQDEADARDVHLRTRRERATAR